MGGELHHKNVHYVLGEGPEEIQRLALQYFAGKDIFDRPTFLPKEVDMTRVHRVLDAAAGSTVWSLDLSDQPEASSLDLHATDITLSKFPPKRVLEKAHITAFEHDLTLPFPEEMHGTFDLVHMTALVFAFNQAEWLTVLRNVHEVLAPGGYLILKESDPVVYTSSDPPPPDGVQHDVEKCIDGPGEIHSMNAIMVGLMRKHGFIIGLSDRLVDFLSLTSFSPLLRDRMLYPYGALADEYRSLSGRSLSHLKDSTAENMERVLDSLSKAVLKDGPLEAPKGVYTKTEAERQTLIKGIRSFVDAKGVVMVVTEFLAQKMTASALS